MTPLEILAFELPGDQYSSSDRMTALELAAEKRPWCLSEADMDTAQALYAAWLLVMRAGKVSGAVPTAGVVSLKEGDLAITYGKATDTSDTYGFKARYDALARRCPAKMVRGVCVK